jgi:hypothetical protein
MGTDLRTDMTENAPNLNASTDNAASLNDRTIARPRLLDDTTNGEDHLGEEMLRKDLGSVGDNHSGEGGHSEYDGEHNGENIYSDENIQNFIGGKTSGMNASTDSKVSCPDLWDASSRDNPLGRIFFKENLANREEVFLAKISLLADRQRQNRMVLQGENGTATHISSA